MLEINIRIPLFLKSRSFKDEREVNNIMKRYAIIFLSVILLMLITGCDSKKSELKDEEDPSIWKTEEFSGKTEQPDMTDKVVHTEQPQKTRDQEKIDNDSEESSDASLVAQILPTDDKFVKVMDYIPQIIIDLKYATADNFTGAVIYDFSEAYLRYGTVKKLAEVQKELESQGLGLKIWDAFRPVSAQFRLWEIYPDATYVANPNKGFSSHSRGNTVDVTLVDLEGEEVEMPTGFDDFTTKADRDYEDCGKTERENAELLEKIMLKHEFKPYQGEWWHYSDCTQYEVEEKFDLSNASISSNSMDDRTSN